MQETKYYCDKCKKEEGSLFDVTLQLTVPYSLTPSSHKSGVRRDLQLCMRCADVLGLIKKVIEGEKIKAEPTTAEKLYDIISQISWENSSQS